MKQIYFFGSIFIFFLIVVTAVYGLFVPGAYSRETANWATQAKAQDWMDLLLAAPILLIKYKNLVFRVCWQRLKRERCGFASGRFLA